MIYFIFEFVPEFIHWSLLWKDFSCFRRLILSLSWKSNDRGGLKFWTCLHATVCKEWRPFTQIYSTGVARVPTVVSGAFYYRLDVYNLRKLLLQTQFLSNYPTIIIFYLYNNIPQVNNKCIISCNHLLTCY
jgi:hypothetical protein